MTGRNYGLGIAVVVLDQLTKYFVLEKKIFPVVENPLLPFGINFPGAFNFFVVLAALAAFIFFSMKYFSGSHKTAAWNLIVGGAVSNLLDRAGDGRVTDFINIKIGILNIADLAIFLGVAIYVAKDLFRRRARAAGGTRSN